MDERKKILILKFLEIHFSNLEIKEFKDGKYKLLYRNNSKNNLYLLERKNNSTYINKELVMKPILNMFSTNYNKTYEIVNEWFLKKYNIL